MQALPLQKSAEAAASFEYPRVDYFAALAADIGCQLHALPLVDLALSFNSEQCYREALAEKIVMALSAAWQLPNTVTSNIHLCLHEALCNAVIHGNLSIPGAAKTTIGLERFYSCVEARLSEPEFSQRKVFLLITRRYLGQSPNIVVDVIDQGKGFDYSLLFHDDAALASHQGLTLIKKLSTRTKILGAGNHIQMEFSYGA